MDATNTQTGLRIPNDLLTQLRALADQDMRTLNKVGLFKSQRNKLIIDAHIVTTKIRPLAAGQSSRKTAFSGWMEQV